MIRRTVREWERISYGTDENTIPTQYADRIVAEAKASAFSGHGGEGILEHGRKGLRARGVVGVIATPSCQLEILPKIEGPGESNSDDATLRRRLIHMLAIAMNTHVDARAITQLGWQRDTVLELLIRLYCNKLADALRRGFPQQYANHEDDLPSLRGRLDVNRQFTTLAFSPQKLACRFDARSPDISLNQVMRAVVAKLCRIAQAPDNQRILRELSFAYADISEVFPSALRWDLIVLDRTNTRWQELLSLARLFLGDRHQQTTTGSIEGHALLFKMNTLFEEYVARLLARAFAGTDLSVSAQGGHRNCLFEGNTGRFQTRPDLIVRQGDRIALIIDTKWKRITGRIEDPKRGVSQSDVYQVMTYGRLYDCPKVMLLYPHHGELKRDPILKRYSIAKRDAEESVFVATLDISGPLREQQIALKGLIMDRLDSVPAARRERQDTVARQSFRHVSNDRIRTGSA
ncbi:MAG: restriction endonuclease [Rhodobacteraceae bacterium]|nr:restriction endonuclease [Paracoccaceae bacterium]MCY4140094.1 restriction endonuclease [Paracoccaceae bacterium]